MTPRLPSGLHTHVKISPPFQYMNTNTQLNTHTRKLNAKFTQHRILNGNDTFNSKQGFTVPTGVGNTGSWG